MTSLFHFLANAPRLDGHAPWPCFALDQGDWTVLLDRLARESWLLLGLWGIAEQAVRAGSALEGRKPPLTGMPPLSFQQSGSGPAVSGPSVSGEILMALADLQAPRPEQSVAVVSLYCPDGHYPAVSPARPCAWRMERSLWDLTGLEPGGLSDERPWLDHGLWPLLQPLGPAFPVPRSQHSGQDEQNYGFAGVATAGDIQDSEVSRLDLGPLRPGMDESGRFHFHLHGDLILRCETRLGYKHRGIETLIAGRMPLEAVWFANRLAGDSAVAHAWAFSAAIEAALSLHVPPRALLLRALMAECERLAHHLSGLARICERAGFPLLENECRIMREDCLRASDACFGHRLLMDQIIPGGVRNDLTRAGRDHLRHLVESLAPSLEAFADSCRTGNSPADRLRGTGPLALQALLSFGATGPLARAAGLNRDARRLPGYAPWDSLPLSSPCAPEPRPISDCADRFWQIVEEARASLGLLEHLLDQTPGAVQSGNRGAGGETITGAILDLPAEDEIRHRLQGMPGEGLSVIEGPRGQILCWLRLAPDGSVARAFPADPSWFQWPLLELAVAGQSIEDFPLCEAVFNPSIAAADL